MIHLQINQLRTFCHSILLFFFSHQYARWKLIPDAFMSHTCKISRKIGIYDSSFSSFHFCLIFLGMAHVTWKWERNVFPILSRAKECARSRLNILNPAGCAIPTHSLTDVTNGNERVRSLNPPEHFRLPRFRPISWGRSGRAPDRPWNSILATHSWGESNQSFRVYLSLSSSLDFIMHVAITRVAFARSSCGHHGKPPRIVCQPFNLWKVPHSLEIKRKTLHSAIVCECCSRCPGHTNATHWNFI